MRHNYLDGGSALWPEALQQPGKSEQILNPERRPSLSHHHERVGGHGVSPASREATHAAVLGEHEYAVLSPVTAPEREVELLPNERMERMGNPHPQRPTGPTRCI